MAATTILIGLFLVLLLLRVPVAYAMIISSIVFIFTSDLPPLQITQKIAGGVDSFPLLAIPMFLFAGNLMNTMGITERIFAFASAMVRHVTGGLGHVNVLASIIFAGMSGSSVADAGGLGVVEMKAMRKAGYDDGFSAAVTAASATIGPIIPPSIIMVVYGFIAEESVGRLFLAGVTPGLLMGLSMMVLIYVMAKTGIYHCPRMPRATLGEVVTTFRGAMLPLCAPVLLIGGILMGAFTPTEAGVVVILFVLAIGIIYLRFNLRHILDAMLVTVRTTAATMFIIAASMIYSYIIVRQNLPEQVAGWFEGYLASPLAVLTFVVVVLLILGMFIEAIPVLIITVPTFMILAAHAGIDPIHLGIVVVLTMMIGSLTPPVGLTLYTVMVVANMSMPRLTRALWPFYFAILAVVILVAVVPEVTLWLPDLAFGKVAR